MKSKRRLRWLTGLVIASLAVGSMGGCGSSKDSTAAVANGGFASENAVNRVSKDEAYYEEGFADMNYAETEAYAPAEDAGAGMTNGGTIQQAQPKRDKRKLIKTVNMQVETQDFDRLMTSVETRVDELGGYIQNLDSRNNSTYGGKNSRYASLVVRIPAGMMDQFVDSVATQSNVTQKTLNVEDVTLSYVDMESRKKSLQIEQERLLALLDRAEILEDIITLENRLTSVRYQIESMESQLRTYDDLVDYSTINLNIREVIVYTPVKEMTPWEKMTEGFMESLTDVRDGFVDFGVWFVVHIPQLVIWVVVIGCGFLILRGAIRRRKGKKAGKTQEEKKPAPDKEVEEK